MLTVSLMVFKFSLLKFEFETRIMYTHKPRVSTKYFNLFNDAVIFILFSDITTQSSEINGEFVI